jgi:flagellar hook-length control protein FliK
MKASLPTFTLATGSAAGLSGPETEFAGIQGDRGIAAGFPALLDRAHSAFSAEFAAVLPGAVDTLSLPRQLQILPQTGNLLPLLEQVVEAASAKGAEPRQVLLQIAEKLNQQGAQTEANPAAALASALQQTLDELPSPTVSAARDALASASGDVKMSSTAPVADALSGRSPLEPVQRHTEAQDGTKMPSFDRTIDQLQLRQPEQRQTELAGLMATLKRLTPRPQVPSDTTTLRAESVTAPVSVPTSQAPAAATTSLPTLSVSTPLAQGDWDQGLGERIQWMVNRKVQGAQIRLNPTQLGPMEVRIQVHNDQASIQFSSAHSVVREALEAALPRLRELLESSGVELVDVDVSGQSSAGGQRARDEDGALGRGTPLIDAAGGSEMVLETPIDYVPENGRLDLFA